VRFDGSLIWKVATPAARTRPRLVATGDFTGDRIADYVLWIVRAPVRERVCGGKPMAGVPSLLRRRTIRQNVATRRSATGHLLGLAPRQLSDLPVRLRHGIRRRVHKALPGPEVVVVPTTRKMVAF
jgi:hypothetical protein